MKPRRPGKAAGATPATPSSTRQHPTHSQPTNNQHTTNQPTNQPTHNQQPRTNQPQHPRKSGPHPRHPQGGPLGFPQEEGGLTLPSPPFDPPGRFNPLSLNFIPNPLPSFHLPPPLPSNFFQSLLSLLTPPPLLSTPFLINPPPSPSTPPFPPLPFHFHFQIPSLPPLFTWGVSGACPGVSGVSPGV